MLNPDLYASSSPKKKKRVPNYMRPNAAWLGKDKQEDDLAATQKLSDMRNKRKSLIANKIPDLSRLVSMKPKAATD